MGVYVPNARMKAFFDAELSSLVEWVRIGRHRLPLVQERLVKNLLAIKRRYPGQRLHMSLYDESSPSHPNGLMAARIDGNKPKVVIVLPSMMRWFKDVQKFGGRQFRKAFRNSAMIGMIHELDHLVDTPAPMFKKVSSRLNIASEAETWALTCQKTIRLFVDVYGEPIDADTQSFYDAWLKAGRNAKSRKWLDFIASIYGPKKKRAIVIA